MWGLTTLGYAHVAHLHACSGATIDFSLPPPTNPTLLQALRGGLLTIYAKQAAFCELLGLPAEIRSLTSLRVMAVIGDTFFQLGRTEGYTPPPAGSGAGSGGVHAGAPGAHAIARSSGGQSALGATDS